jgi:hypothetical protein
VEVESAIKINIFSRVLNIFAVLLTLELSYRLANHMGFRQNPEFEETSGKESSHLHTVCYTTLNWAMVEIRHYFIQCYDLTPLVIHARKS